MKGKNRKIVKGTNDCGFCGELGMDIHHSLSLSLPTTLSFITNYRILDIETALLDPVIN
jgi:hypothetical protein